MADFFSQHEFVLEAAHDGRRGLLRALEGSFDLVLLDGMLPALDGFEVLKQLRRRSSVPVIMLTARIEERDRIAGLNAGADDYLPKPFELSILIARLKACCGGTSGCVRRLLRVTVLCSGRGPSTSRIWKFKWVTGRCRSR